MTLLKGLAGGWAVHLRNQNHVAGVVQIEFPCLTSRVSQRPRIEKRAWPFLIPGTDSADVQIGRRAVQAKQSARQMMPEATCEYL